MKTAVCQITTTTNTTPLIKRLLLSDLFEELIEGGKIPERIKYRFPELTQKQYSSSLDIIWWLLSSMQYWDELRSVENNGVLEKDEADKHINAYKKWLENFENEPWQ